MVPHQVSHLQAVDGGPHSAAPRRRAPRPGRLAGPAAEARPDCQLRWCPPGQSQRGDLAVTWLLAKSPGRSTPSGCADRSAHTSDVLARPALTAPRISASGQLTPTDNSHRQLKGAKMGTPARVHQDRTVISEPAKRRARKGAPPRPRAHLVLGSALDLRRSQAETYARVMREHGDVVRLAAGPPGLRVQLYCVFHPDGVRQVLAGRGTVTPSATGSTRRSPKRSGGGCSPPRGNAGSVSGG